MFFEKKKPHHRENNAVIAKMNVLFDKATFEKNRPIKNVENNELKEDAESVAEEDGKVIKDTILNSIQSAKLGALTVDPGYLHFRTLDSKRSHYENTAYSHAHSMHS